VGAELCLSGEEVGVAAMNAKDSIPEITRLAKQLFAKQWIAIDNQNPFADKKLNEPGVYLLAYSNRNLSDRPIDPKDVFYVGMTCSVGGLKSRLRQFVAGTQGKYSHSAARRFFRENSRKSARKHFFYAALPFICVASKGKANPRDFRQLGHISCVEYYSIARILEKTGKRPPLNKLGPRPAI
jgi:hypothetical protein